jgi:MauM/NapG family ferredoxin protein
MGCAIATQSKRAAGTPALRPPGALREPLFVGLCVRCGNCVRACPTAIIQVDKGENGLAALMTPRLDFRRDYCLEDCVQCTAVCPSGALEPLVLRDKPKHRIGDVQVDMELCLLGDDRDCAMCRNWCPYEAIRLEFDEVEYTLTPRIDSSRCPGCGACEVACPTTPDKAIVVVAR